MKTQSIGVELLALRRKHQLTQMQVVKQSGIQRPLLIEIERGRVTPNEDMAAKIRRAIEELHGER